MLYHPEVIMYLWFLPITVLILIPLALRTVGLFLKMTNMLPDEEEINASIAVTKK